MSRSGSKIGARFRALLVLIVLVVAALGLSLAELRSVEARNDPARSGAEPDRFVLQIDVTAAEAALPGATICVFGSDDDWDRDLDLCVVADAEGRARIAMTRPDSYVVRVELEGFVSTVLGPFEVRPRDLGPLPSWRPAGCSASTCFYVVLNPDWKHVHVLTVP